MANETQKNKQREKLIAKLVEIKRRPKIIAKTNKETGRQEEYFYASFMWNGKQQQLTNKSLSDFVEKVDNILSQLSSQESKDKKQSLPLKAAFNIYLQEIRLPKLKEYTEERRQRNYKHDFSNAQILYKFFESKGIEYLHEIDTNTLQSFRYHSIHEKHNSETTFYRKLVVLKSLNKYVTQHTNYAPAECNFAIFEKPKTQEMINHLTEKQIDTLLELSPIYLQRLIKFFLYTGMRRQNGFDLKWAEIDFINKQITVSIKQNKIHTVPIIKLLFEILSEIKEEQIKLYGELKEYVFLYNGNRLKNAYLSMKNVFKKANIQLPSGQLFHVFRHTCAVMLINKGVDLYTIQKILGHSSTQMTQKYARLQTETMAKEMERVFGK